MLLSFRRIGRWARVLALISVLALFAVACEDEEEEKDPRESGAVTRDAQIPIVIPAGEPIVIGVSTALTGPAETRGTQYRNAAVVSVEQWKEANGTQIGGHEIQVYPEDDGCSAAGVAKVRRNDC